MGEAGNWNQNFFPHPKKSREGELSSLLFPAHFPVLAARWRHLPKTVSSSEKMGFPQNLERGKFLKLFMSLLFCYFFKKCIALPSDRDSDKIYLNLLLQRRWRCCLYINPIYVSNCCIGYALRLKCDWTSNILQMEEAFPTGQDSRHQIVVLIWTQSRWRCCRRRTRCIQH